MLALSSHALFWRMTSFYSPYRGKVVHDPVSVPLSEETREFLEHAAKRLWKVVKVAAICLLDVCRRVLVLIPMLCMLFLLGYGIIYLRWGAVWAARVLSAAFHAILAIVNGAVSIGSIFSRKHHSLTVTSILGSWVDEVLDIPTECTICESWQDEVFFFARLTTHNTLCPVVRYTDPIPWLYDVFHGIFGLFILDPTPNGGNCVLPRAGWLCWVLGLGWFFRDFLIAFLLAVEIIAACWPLITLFFKTGKEFFTVLKDETGDIAKKGRKRAHHWWNGA